MSEHQVERRGPYPITQRRLEVQSVERLTPRYARVVLKGDLWGFESAALDDHVKLFFPIPGSDDVAFDRERMRDFTPRHFDVAKGTLTIDFALHGAGIANAWAEAAKPGSVVGVAGPRGSTSVPADFDWYLLVGDETALPAIGRRLEELPATANVTAFIEVDSEADVLPLARPVTWLFRRGALPGSAGLISAAVEGFERPAGDGYVFAAAEAAEMRAVRTVLEAKGHRKDWSRVIAYWKRGEADFHEGH